MHFKTLAIAAILANFCVLAPVEAATLFNNNTSATGGSTAAAPVFIQAPPKPATQPVSNNLYTNSGQNQAVPQAAAPMRTKPMSDQEYAQMAASVAKQNAAVGAQRSAEVNSNFAEVAQQNAQARAAEKAARSQAAGGGKAAPTQAAQPADPYAGHTVVFTGAKKADGDKPNRLFNVQ